MMQSTSNLLKNDRNEDKLNYIYSCDLDDVCFRIKVGTLEGEKEELNYKDVIESDNLKFSQHNLAHSYITCKILSNEKLLCASQQTAYKEMNKRLEWNEWLLFSVKFADLPRDSFIEFTIWDTIGPNKKVAVGQTGINIFGKYGAMRKAMYDLPIWSCQKQSSEISEEKLDHGIKFISDKMKKVYKLKKQYRNGQLPKVDWLDRLTFLDLEKITQTEKNNSNLMFLSIEFPKVTINGLEHTIVYFEKGAEESCQFSFIENELVIIPEPEMSMENIAESKHHKLSRSVRSGVCDRDLKPNAATRDQLNAIVLYPPTKVLTSEEQDLLWKFRFYLVNQKKALTKFLKTINWQLTNEANQAIELLSNWEPIDIEDALELLSPQFQHPAVRRYAVTRLSEAPDDELLLYLLQLVQALKYENFQTINEAYKKEKEEAIIKNLESSTPERKSSQSSELHFDEVSKSIKNDDNSNIIEETEEIFQTDLATFLINRACSSDILANYFYWYLIVECEENYTNSKEKSQSNIHDMKVSEMYSNVMNRFSHKLFCGGIDLKTRRSMLKRQLNFIEKLVQLMKVVARENGNRKKKIERLQSLLSDVETFKITFTPDNPLPLPLDPSIQITGIIPEKATLFKSALMPSLLVFSTTDNTEYFAIFKHGDDLRQDQLILQMITLMDKLLRRENNLDLKLTPYRVLATSSKHGLVQYMESISVAEVLNAEGSIQNYFRRIAPSNSTPNGISSEVMDAYVKSCAGYCVITYLLGIGDRHLDNLLLTKTGKLFHVDFGFILGRDPKPFAPPMKLSREMVDAMGGTNSDYYQLFRTLCYTAFLHLRSHANLILNLFSLMVDANVPDIALEPDKTVKKVQDRFRMDLSDEEAVHYMQNLIDVSVKALFPAVVENFHKMAQYLRN